jgi:hypothetical protein
MTPLLRILGIAGSLRKASFNRALLRAAHDLAPPGVAIETFDLNGVPPYNDDLLATPPTRVTRLKEAVRAADAVLLATPEYNYSIPGVLKNAIDWGSRPIRENAWARVPVAILGAPGFRRHGGSARRCRCRRVRQLGPFRRDLLHRRGNGRRVWRIRGRGGRRVRLGAGLFRWGSPQHFCVHRRAVHCRRGNVA